MHSFSVSASAAPGVSAAHTVSDEPLGFSPVFGGEWLEEEVSNVSATVQPNRLEGGACIGVFRSACIHTPAKVNLFLNAQGVREDGYHQIQTVMAPFALRDTFRFTWASSEAVEPSGQRWDLPSEVSVCPVSIVFCTTYPALAALPQEKNLVFQALGVYVHQYPLEYSILGKGFRDGGTLCITLEKRIPVEAGLGGGSGNAAGLLWWLDHQVFPEEARSRREGCSAVPLKSIQARLERLTPLAAQLGSDVPYFLSVLGGQPVRELTGRGDVLTERDCLPQASGLRVPACILMPLQGGVSTMQAYHWMREAAQSGEQPYCKVSLTPLVTALQQCCTATDFIDAVSPHLHNDFQSLEETRLPYLATVTQLMQSLQAQWSGASEAGAPPLVMTVPFLCGSGAAMVCFASRKFRDGEQTQLQQSALEAGLRAWFTELILSA